MWIVVLAPFLTVFQDHAAFFQHRGKVALDVALNMSTHFETQTTTANGGSDKPGRDNHAQ